MAAKVAQAATAPLSGAYDPKAYEEAERQLNLMKGLRKGHLFSEFTTHYLALIDIGKKFVEATGDEIKANRELLLLAVTAAEKRGLLLADARGYVRDPNDLNAAREFLLRKEDENGNEIDPVIEEKRGKNNEIRLYLVEQEEKEKEEEGAEQ